MKKLSIKEAKKHIVQCMHVQYVRMTKEQLINTLLSSAKTDLEKLPASELNILLQRLTDDTFECEIPDSENN